MRWQTPEWPAVRRQAKRLAGWLVVLVFVIVTFAVVFFGTPFEADSASIEAVKSHEGISMERTNGGYVLEPARTDSETGQARETDTDIGLVFYPGARVAPSAYVESLAPVAREANVTVVIPSMPLNLAIVDYGVARTGLRSHAATAEMADRPEIDRWYVGGHSLGGAMACWYADDHREDVEGLILYGSYCDRDIADSGLAALSVAGTQDTVIDASDYERGLEKLPADATVVELDGLNHTQFGSYSGQRGDTATGTSYADAHARLNEVVVHWFQDEIRQFRDSEFGS